MPSSKQMNWDAAADRKMLLGILKTHNVKVDIDAMAAYMSTPNITCTASAVSNRIKKLKALAKDSNLGGTPDDGRTPNQTSRKRNADKAGAAETPSAKKGKKTSVYQDYTSDANQEDDEEKFLKPVKDEKDYD